LVVCPKCGSNLQARKLLWLTNLNTIRCQVCSSKLQVKNKSANSAIGGALGGLGAGIGTLLFMLFFWTGNIVFLGLTVLWFVGILVFAWLLVVKFIKVKLFES
jgi:DNA-directed RNA polymerase subunit RPC12/RpoP